MKLVLHVGASELEPLTPYLTRIQSDLAEQGVHLPSAAESSALASLIRIASESTGEAPAAEAEGGTTEAPSGPEAPDDPLVAGMKTGIAAADAAGRKVWLLSDGTLFRSLETHRAVRGVHRLLSSLFAEVEVVLHLRPQLDLLAHEIGRRAAAGLANTEDDLLDSGVFGPRSAHLNYNNLVERWEKAFGADAVRVVPFRRQPDLLAFLCERLGVDPRALGTDRPAELPQAGWRAVALANLLSSDEAGAGALRRHFADLPPSEPAPIASALAMRIQSRFTISNKKLVGRRSDVGADDLVRRAEDFPAETEPRQQEGAAAVAEELRALVGLLERDVRMERYFRLLADWRQAVAEGRADALDGLKAEIDALAPTVTASVPDVAEA